MNPKQFKTDILNLLNQNYKIEFLGNDFDKICSRLTFSRADKIYVWIRRVVSRRVQPIIIGNRGEYKDWSSNELLIFRYPFRIGNDEYRILFVKVKNSIYIEFHLGNHKYYDRIRKDMA